MFKNYLVIATRHLFRHKFFSAINILCLAIGITFSLVIGVYALNQYSVNASLKNIDRQYLVKSNWKVKEMGLDITTLGPLPKALKEEYPSLVANYYRYNPVTNVVSAGDKHFKEDIAIGDTTLISMYGFTVLFGNKQHPFSDNNSAVITETMAVKLFGEKDATNKVISILTTHDGEKQDYKVSAVVRDLPVNSVTHLIGNGYSVFVPTVGNRYYAGGDPSVDWAGIYEVGAVELQPGVFPKNLEKPLKQLLAKYASADIQRNLIVELAPVRNYYLNDHNGAVRKMVTMLSLAAFFILLIAVINFVNINIGTSSYRLKEIGLRKVFGSLKRQVALQFLVEALILTGMASVLSLGLYEILRPAFNQVLNTELVSLLHFDASAFGYLVLLVLLTGLVAGIYPAFILSSSGIINAVKGKLDSAKGGLALRKSMLVVQFALGTVVFICALTVSRQVSYIFSKDIGYRKEGVMVLTAFPKQWDAAGIAKMMAIRTGMAQIPVVKNASLSFEIPDRKPPGSISLQATQGNAKPALITSCAVDENYAATFGLELLSGSFFSRSGGFIPNQLVLNESAAKALGLTVQSAVGAQVTSPSFTTPSTVAGVIKDYHYSSLQERVEPLAFFHVRDATAYRFLSLKVASPDMKRTTDLIKKRWQELSPDAPFEYTFMEDKFQSLYSAELQLKKAGAIATTLNLLIILLGIFGVVAFTITKRTKEIAVRKVLGANSRNIVLLFLKDYAGLILLANFIAWPVAYQVTNKWLENYAYRIDQSVVLYMAVCLSLFSLAFLLITIQCLKASRSNPVKNLRTE